MSAFDVVAWLVHIVTLVWAWPWLSDRSRVRRPLFWLSCVLPIISWCWLIPEGLSTRRGQRAKVRRQVQEARRAEAVKFLRDQLSNGTPLEQDNARQLLAMWGESETAPPVDENAPVIVRTSDPGDVRSVGNWLVVGGLQRAHLEPPSLELYDRGCRCPACVQLAESPPMRREPTFADAVEKMRREIVAGLGFPPAQLVGPEDCPDCDIDEIVGRNGSGQVCVTYLTGRTCRAHGNGNLSVTVSSPRRRFRH
jgi:hypothetical protein